MLRIGTRGSELALWQANYIADRLGRKNAEIIVIKTSGDREQELSFNKMEGKGFFTKEIEQALLESRIDIAVHSLKDLPTEKQPGLTIAAVPEREDPADLILADEKFSDPSNASGLSAGTVVGTSSMRRIAQLLHIDPSIKINQLRGNVPTRIRKLREGMYGAVVLAHAGIKRIRADIEGLVVRRLDTDTFLPAPAQGALGLQVRDGDEAALNAVSPLNHAESAIAVAAERAFLEGFGGGCHIPLGAYAYIDNDVIYLSGSVTSPNGITAVRGAVNGTDPRETGFMLADILKKRGAESLI